MSGPLLLGVAATYAIGMFYPKGFRKTALAISGAASVLTAAWVGLFLILPDFSGYSYTSRHRTETLILFFANAGLAITNAVAISQNQKLRG